MVVVVMMMMMMMHMEHWWNDDWQGKNKLFTEKFPPVPLCPLYKFHIDCPGMYYRLVWSSPTWENMCSWELHIGMNLGRIGCEGVDWIQLIPDMVECI
jgi:hypothetical protein